MAPALVSHLDQPARLGRGDRGLGRLEPVPVTLAALEPGLDLGVRPQPIRGPNIRQRCLQRARGLE